MIQRNAKGQIQVNDLTGRRFGWLTVLRQDGFHKNGDAVWLCQCGCGNQKSVKSSNLIAENVTSCGCKRQIRHAAFRKRQNTGDGISVLLDRDFDA
jgi:hypothetical protein